MNPDELLHLLTSMDAAHAMAQAVRDPEMQIARGWDLQRWRCDAVDEAVRFVHLNRHGRPVTALLCVKGPEACTWIYEATLRMAPFPTRLVVLE
jgi:hypothetical protein